jgi:hypothetical protein
MRQFREYFASTRRVSSLLRLAGGAGWTPVGVVMRDAAYGTDTKFREELTDR